MYTFDGTSLSILASASKARPVWTFEVTTVAGAQYKWATASIGIQDTLGDGDVLGDGDILESTAFTAKVVDFGGITMRRSNSELHIIAPSSMTFSVVNPATALNPSLFDGADVVVSLLLENIATGTLHTIRRWGFSVIYANASYEKIDFSCEDYFQQYLDGDYPNTQALQELFPTSQTPDSYCVPVTFGDAYISVAPVLYDDGVNEYRYYVIGAASEALTVIGWKTPADIEGVVTFADTDPNWSAGGQWAVNGVRLWSTSASAAGNYAAVSGDVLAPIRVRMTGGSYPQEPAALVAQVLLDMGVPNNKIDWDSVTAADVWTAASGLVANGGFWAYQPRKQVLSELLVQFSLKMVMGEQIRIEPWSVQSIAQVDSSNIMAKKVGGSFIYKGKDTRKAEETAFVAWVPADKPIDVLTQDPISTTAVPTQRGSKVFPAPFIHDGTIAKKVGTLALQKQMWAQADINFQAHLSLLSLDPEDTVSVSGAHYGPVPLYSALVESTTVTKDLRLTIKATHYHSPDSHTEYLDDFSTVSVGATSWSEDDLTGTFQPVYTGPDNDGANPDAPNWVDGPFRVGNATTHIRFDPTATARGGPLQHFAHAGVDRVLIGDLYDIGAGTYDAYGMVGYDTAGNKAFELSTISTKLSLFDFTQDALISGTAATTLGMGLETTDSKTGFWAGAAAFDAAPFSVTNAGVLKATNAAISGAITATSGTIGGFTIATAPDRLYAGTGNSRIQLEPNSGIWLGADLFASAPFSVSQAGVLVATSGTIGGWSLGADTLYSSGIILDATAETIQVGSGSPHILIDGVSSSVETSDFTTGSIGWRILGDGSAEFNNIAVRGELRTSVFVADEIHATGGTNVVLTAAVTLADFISGTDTTIDVSAGAVSGQLFQNNDIMRIKYWTGASMLDLWYTVTLHSAISGGHRYNVTYQSGTQGSTITAGATVVNYGQSGDGYALMTSDLANGPYYDIATHAGAPWTTVTSRGRFGNLAGITSPNFGSLSGYGFWTDNGYLEGAFYAAGDVTIGNPSTGDGITWVQSTGTLTIVGDVTINGGVTIQWADVLDGAGTKPADNATVGATWGTDLLSIPGRFNYEVDPTGQGAALFLTPDALGYWDGAGWASYIDKYGTLELVSGVGTGLKYFGSNQTGYEGDLEIGDYDGGQGIYWDQSAGTLQITGTLSILPAPSNYEVEREYFTSADGVKFVGDGSGDDVLGHSTTFTIAGPHPTVDTEIIGNKLGNVLNYTYPSLYTHNTALSGGDLVVHFDICVGGTPDASAYAVIFLSNISVNSFHVEIRFFPSSNIIRVIEDSGAGDVAVGADYTAWGMSANTINRVSVIYSVDSSDVRIYDNNGNLVKQEALTESYDSWGMGGVLGADACQIDNLLAYIEPAASTASWATLVGKPDGATVLLDDIDTPVADGLYMSAERIGFYDVSEAGWLGRWEKSGNFFLSGVGGGSLSWTQATATLAIEGAITATSGLITGTLVMGEAGTPSGIIHSYGKSTYASTTAGFFLGYDAVELDYVLNIGDGTNYLKWDGTNLEITGFLGTAAGGWTIGSATLTKDNMEIGAAGYIQLGPAGNTGMRWELGSGIWFGASLASDAPTWIGNDGLFRFGGADGTTDGLQYDGVTVTIDGVPVATVAEQTAETTAAMDRYVNESTGNNNNDGLTSSTAWQTLQYAIDQIPKNLKHLVRIYVGSNLTAGGIIENFRGHAKLYVNFSIYTVTAAAPLLIRGCSAAVQIYGSGRSLITNAGAGRCIDIDTCTNVLVSDVQCEGSGLAGNDYALYIAHSTVFLDAVVSVATQPYYGIYNWASQVNISATCDFSGTTAPYIKINAGVITDGTAFL